MFLIKELSTKLGEELSNKLESIFKEALKRKGFEFNSDKDLENFIRLYVSCQDNIGIKQRIYYISDTPFFLHNYETEIVTNPKGSGEPYVISASLGTYSFL